MAGSSLPEFMLALAAAQGKNIEQNQENYYRPAKTEADINLKQGQLSEIPQKIRLAYAAEQLKQAQAQRIPGLMNLDNMRGQQLGRDLNEPNYKSNYAKAVRDAELIKQKYGADSEQAKGAAAYLQHVAQGNQMTIFDPKTGQPLVSLGGGGAKGGAQRTYNPATGEIKVMPTTAMTTRLQKALVGEQAIASNIGGLIKDVAPYLGENRWKQLYDMVNQVNPLASDKTRAIGNERKSSYDAAINSLRVRAEALMSAANVNVTDQATRMMLKVMVPQKMENAKTYELRIRKTLKYLSDQQKSQQQALAGGISIPAQGMTNEGMQEATSAWEQMNGEMDDENPQDEENPDGY